MDSLRAINLFEDCSNNELVEVMRLVTVLDLPAGRLLTRQGEAGRECFVIAHGATRIERNGFVSPPTQAEIVGELALMDHVPRTATVTTVSPTRVLVMSQREFSGLRRLDIPSVMRSLDATAAAHRAALEQCPPNN
jgi:CRP-like cAMP-binding protein